MKSFVDWTSEIAAANNPPKLDERLYECTQDGTIKFHSPLELAKRGIENGTDWMRGAQWDPAELGSDRTVMTHRIQGKTADVMLIDEAARIDPEKLENLRKQYLGDWGPYDKDEAEKAVGSLHVHNSRGPARHHDYRVGQSVGQLMACLHPDHSLVVEKLRGRSPRHPRTSIRVMDGRGTFLHEVIVE